MATAKKASAKGDAKKSPAATIATSTLTVKASPKSRFVTIAVELERAFKRAGCPGCRSGIDKIVFQDQVINKVK